MKNCSKCHKTKPLEDFHVSVKRYDGRNGICKDCASIKNRGNRDYFKKRRKERFATDPEFRKKYSSRHEKDKVKDSARAKVQYAVKHGKLVRLACVFINRSDIACGDGVAVPHHEDYGKPLEVIWMCQLHHRRYHLGELSLDSFPSRGTKI